MKNRRVHLLIVLVLFVALATFTLFTARTSSGQATRQKSSPTTTRATSRVTPAANAAFATAATQNATLRNELTWTFGGKQQRGWYLYDLLIAKNLDTPHDADST